MAYRVLSGIICGTLVSGLALGATSVLLSQDRDVRPDNRSEAPVAALPADAAPQERSPLNASDATPGTKQESQATTDQDISAPATDPAAFAQGGASSATGATGDVFVGDAAGSNDATALQSPALDDTETVGGGAAHSERKAVIGPDTPNNAAPDQDASGPDTPREDRPSQETASQKTHSQNTPSLAEHARSDMVAGVRPRLVAPPSPDARAPALATPSAALGDVPADTERAPVPVPNTADSIASPAEPEQSEAPTAPKEPKGQAAPDLAAAPDLTQPARDVALSLSTEPAQPPAPAVPAQASPLVPAPEGREGGNAVAPQASEAEVSEPSPERAAERPAVRRLLPSEPETPQKPARPELSGRPDQNGRNDTAFATVLRPDTRTPTRPLTDRQPGNSSRLPFIGDEGGAGGGGAAPGEQAGEQGANVAALRPVQRYAAAVAADPARPQMSIVLVDDGTGPLGPDTLDGVPFPVSFALDPTDPGAAERMAAYRAAGYEVAALVDLPDAVAPQDVEQILAGVIAALPETVAFVEAPSGGVPAERAVVDQITQFAADSGHGLVFLPEGLNTAQTLAARAAVPALRILRDFDGQGQDARTKRRFLDGAAFRARRDGAVVMLGRLTPDTLSALVLWSLQDRAASVSLVPVSRLLLATVTDNG